MESKSKINWTDDLQHSFQLAQKSLSSNHTITLPRPADQLWIVTNGAQKFGLGATLYITRGSSLLLAGFFSAKIRKNQSTWLQCEIEALAIAAAIKHFSPYIIQSNHTTCILTDSKPCVQAYEKLSRGEVPVLPHSFPQLVDTRLQSVMYLVHPFYLRISLVAMLLTVIIPSARFVRLSLVLRTVLCVPPL